MIKKYIGRLTGIFREYPAQFWILTASSFIDTLGRTILFPFFTLYITKHFGIGMATAGILLAIFSLTGMIGSLVGGALADKLGRKIMIILGLLLSAGSSLVMGFINELAVFYFVAAVTGLLSDIGHPARNAIVADILPEEKRAGGYGITRVVQNLSWVVGPSIGGFLASKSYMYLFFSDAVLSTITALIVVRFIADTKPQLSEGQESQSFRESLAGYKDVLKNGFFTAFILVLLVMLLVYQQLYSTLSVFLRDYRGIPETGYGMMMSINACIVVIFQFWISRITEKYNPFLMIALEETVFYLVGYTAFGFIYGFYFLLAAVILITIGEMIMIPVQLSIVAKLSPEHMRGRYMAAAGFSWSVASMVGPWAAGMIMDNRDPNLVWKICGIFSLLAICGFIVLFVKSRNMPVFSGRQPSSGDN